MGEALALIATLQAARLTAHRVEQVVAKVGLEMQALGELCLMALAGPAVPGVRQVGDTVGLMAVMYGTVALVVVRLGDTLALAELLEAPLHRLEAAGLLLPLEQLEQPAQAAVVVAVAEGLA